MDRGRVSIDGPPPCALDYHRQAAVFTVATRGKQRWDEKKVAVRATDSLLYNTFVCRAAASMAAEQIESITSVRRGRILAKSVHTNRLPQTQGDIICDPF